MYSRFRKADLMTLALLAAAGTLGACGKSGETMVPQAPPSRTSIQGTPISPLFPGGGSAPAEVALAAQYANDEHAKAEGKRLYDWYNCAGCHFHGAGGIGPSLGDNDWIYGGEMQQIYSTIYQGRPNGMPSWGQKLSSTEIWEIAAYVHSQPDTYGANAGEPVAPLPPVRDGDARMPEIPSSPSANP